MLSLLSSFTPYASTLFCLLLPATFQLPPPRLLSAGILGSHLNTSPSHKQNSVSHGCCFLRFAFSSSSSLLYFIAATCWSVSNSYFSVRALTLPSLYIMALLLQGHGRCSSCWFPGLSLSLHPAVGDAFLTCRPQHCTVSVLLRSPTLLPSFFSPFWRQSSGLSPPSSAAVLRLWQQSLILSCRL